MHRRRARVATALGVVTGCQFLSVTAFVHISPILIQQGTQRVARTVAANADCRSRGVRLPPVRNCAGLQHVAKRRACVSELKAIKGEAQVEAELAQQSLHSSSSNDSNSHDAHATQQQHQHSEAALQHNSNNAAPTDTNHTSDNITNDSSTSSSSSGVLQESKEALSQWTSDRIDGIGGQELFAMMGLCFLVAVICAVDRVAMSVAIVPMAAQFGYSDTTKGLIASAFSWGYMVFMIPAGVLGTFVNPKLVMGGGVLLWSLAQMLSPQAAALGLPTLLLCRFAMGMSESVTIPTIQEIVSQWVPQEQRTRWLALIISGLQMGTVLAYLASPPIINNFTWQMLFLVYGGIGLVWLTLWFPLAKDSPPKALFLQSNAGQLAAESGAEGGSDPLRSSSKGLQGAIESLQAVPWKDFCTDANIWSIAGAHMAHNWGLYVMLAWLPTYFNQEYGLSLSESSSASVAPWVVGAVVGNAAGWAADYLINTNTFSATTVRRSFQTVALIGPGICMYLLSQGTGSNLSSHEAESLFITAVAFGSCSCVGFASSVQDLKSKYTSIIYGLTSAVSVVIGSFGTYITGVLLDNTHSWSYAFQATALAYFIGAAWYGTVYKAEPRLED